MRLNTAIRFAPFAIALALLSSASAAENKFHAWDATRATSPQSVDELKALQNQVKQVVSKTTAATVGIIIGPGAGSGVIISDDGIVLTAAHVIGKPRQRCILVLSDGTTVKGETLGVNARADSGMLKILDKPPKTATWPGAKEGKWPFVEIGKASDLKVGQWLVSLGHPGGPKLERPPPVRLGRLRAQATSKSEPAMGTDCTLVGGDSGGPLFNLNGQVVGIHSRIGLWLESNMHIPTDKFKDEWDRLARGDTIGRRTEAELGITYDSKATGAKVVSLAEEGPAWRADVEAGDIVKKLNGFKVNSPSDITDMLSSYNPGDKVKLLVLRDAKELEIEVKLGKRSTARRN